MGNVCTPVNEHKLNGDQNQTLIRENEKLLLQVKELTALVKKKQDQMDAMKMRLKSQFEKERATLLTAFDLYDTEYNLSQKVRGSISRDLNKNEEFKNEYQQSDIMQRQSKKFATATFRGSHIRKIMQIDENNAPQNPIEDKNNDTAQKISDKNVPQNEEFKNEYQQSGIVQSQQRQSKKIATATFCATLIRKITENDENNDSQNPIEDKNNDAAQTTFHGTHIRKITENDEENAQYLNGQGLEIKNDEKRLLSIDQSNNGPPPLNILDLNNGPPPINMLNIGGPPPINMLGNVPPPINMLKMGGPPPINMLNMGGPPPINMLGNGPPPINMLNMGGPPPINMLNMGGPPPLNMLGGPPPLNMLGGPPPLNMLGGPPPMNMLGGFSSLNMLGGPPPMNMLGGPPPINMLGGPPPLNMMGGPPSLNMLGGPPPLNMGGPPSLNMLGGPSFGPPTVVIPPKKKRNPTTVMKQFVWDKIEANKIKGTIFEKMEDEKIEFDSQFDSEFSDATKSKPLDPLKQSQKQASIVAKTSLLNPDRQKNIEIIFGKIKMKNDVIEEGIWSVDFDFLCNIVESLISTLPNKDDKAKEEKLLKQYDGNIEDLSNADRYLLMLFKIPAYDSRLISIKFMNQYSQMEKDIFTRIKCMRECFIGIQKDQNLKILIEYALAVGNHMNGQGFRGGAHGFKIDMILKLQDCKSNDKKKNLLMFIIEKAEKDTGITLIDPNENLQDLEEATRTPISQISTDLKELSNGIDRVHIAIESQTDQERDLVQFRFNDFQFKAVQSLEMYRKQLEEVQEIYLNCIKFFIEDAKTTSDIFSQKILKFKNQCKDQKNKSIQIQEEIQKSKMKEKEELEKPKNKKKNETLSKSVAINSIQMQEEIQKSIMKEKEELEKPKNKKKNETLSQSVNLFSKQVIN